MRTANAMNRFKAGILSYVMAVGIVISTGLSMLILYLYYSRQEYLNYDIRIRLLENLEVAEEVSLANYGKYEYNQKQVYDLYGQQRDSISIRKKKWGLMDVLEVASFHQKKHYQKSFLVGYYPINQGKSAVYLHNERGVLSLAGDTKLTGNCYLPTGGVQSAYINRIGYTNEELIYGRELTSEKQFPKIGLNDVFDELSKEPGFEMELIDSAYSFMNETEIIEQSDFIVSKSIKGNIILKTSGRVFVSNEAELADLIVTGSVIEFEEGFNGSGQFLATDTIVVNKNVTLNYPSILAVNNPNETTQIYVKEGAKVTGWLLMDGDSDGFRKRLIYLEDDAEVNGMIYCNGMTEIYGRVNGNVTTRRFLVNTPSGIYENYLLNAQINAPNLHSDFLTLNQWFYSDSNEVMKYLY